jgi:hypothetical protein
VFEASGLGRKCSITLEKDTQSEKEIGAYVCITRVSPFETTTDAAVNNTLLYLLEWIAVVRFSLAMSFVCFAAEFNSLLFRFVVLEAKTSRPLKLSATSPLREIHLKMMYQRRNALKTRYFFLVANGEWKLETLGSVFEDLNLLMIFPHTIPIL